LLASLSSAYILQGQHFPCENKAEPRSASSSTEQPKNRGIGKKGVLKNKGCAGQIVLRQRGDVNGKHFFSFRVTVEEEE
jgi:hypothetical protein